MRPSRASRLGLQQARAMLQRSGGEKNEPSRGPHYMQRRKTTGGGFGNCRGLLGPSWSVGGLLDRLDSTPQVEGEEASVCDASH